MTVVILIITAIQQLLLAQLGAAMSAACHADARRQALDRPRHHRTCMAAARHRHAAAVPSGCSRCRSARWRTPTRCRRASCRRASISPTTARCSPRAVPFLHDLLQLAADVAVVVTVGQLVTCTLAAFAFARLNFPGRDSLFFIMLDRADVPGPGDDPADLSRLCQARAAQPADRPGADVPDLELRRLPDAPVHAAASRRRWRKRR